MIIVYGGGGQIVKTLYNKTLLKITAGNHIKGGRHKDRPTELNLFDNSYKWNVFIYSPQVHCLQNLILKKHPSVEVERGVPSPWFFPWLSVFISARHAFTNFINKPWQAYVFTNFSSIMWDVGSNI